jgi:DNA-binding MarR family transcriptional regulator
LTRVLEESLTRTVRIFRRILAVEAQARELTHAQYTALRHLVETGEQRMSDLAAYLELTNSATTGLIGGLDARGLVARRPDPEDGRGVRVDITPAGRKVVGELLEAVRRSLACAFDRLPDPLRHMAVGGVIALAESLEAIEAPGSR